MGVNVLQTFLLPFLAPSPFPPPHLPSLSPALPALRSRTPKIQLGGLGEPQPKLNLVHFRLKI